MIAVATVGFLMMAGRLDVRRAAQIILGCFIMFGASTVAHGMGGAISEQKYQFRSCCASTTVVSIASSPGGKAQPYDPYAGAGLPASSKKLFITVFWGQFSLAISAS